MKRALLLLSLAASSAAAQPKPPTTTVVGRVIKIEEQDGKHVLTVAIGSAQGVTSGATCTLLDDNDRHPIPCDIIAVHKRDTVIRGHMIRHIPPDRTHARFDIP